MFYYFLTIIIYQCLFHYKATLGNHLGVPGDWSARIIKKIFFYKLRARITLEVALINIVQNATLMSLPKAV